MIKQEGWQVCERRPVEWGLRGIGESVRYGPCLGEKYETSGKVYVGREVDTCVSCVFCKFVGDVIQQVVSLLWDRCRVRV